MTDLGIPALLTTARNAALVELRARLAAEGHEAIREGHGCVFGFIRPEGSRLTELADAAGLTKQAVGEAVDDLERLGYLERVPDPTDRRAKIVRLTEKGREAQATGRRILAEVEQRWAEQIGEERVAEMRATLEEIFALVSEQAPAPA